MPEGLCSTWQLMTLGHHFACSAWPAPGTETALKTMQLWDRRSKQLLLQQPVPSTEWISHPTAHGSTAGQTDTQQADRQALAGRTDRRSLGGCSPLALGSPGSGLLCRARAASPGTLGLSTYLGFLTRPAVEMNGAYWTVSTWTTRFLCPVSILCDVKKTEKLLLTHTAVITKISKLLHFQSNEKHMFQKAQNTKAARKQTHCMWCVSCILHVTPGAGLPTLLSTDV